MKYNLYIEDVSVEAVFNKLGGVEGARQFLRGITEAVVQPQSVDTNSRPSRGVMFHSSFIRQNKDGVVILNGQNLDLHLEEAQREGSIMGKDLLEKVEGRPVLNNVVLDFLVQNPLLIPDEWKKFDQILFCGTILAYVLNANDPIIPCLRWIGGEWVADYCWLNIQFDANSPVAVLHT